MYHPTVKFSVPYKDIYQPLMSDVHSCLMFNYVQLRFVKLHFTPPLSVLTVGCHTSLYVHSHPKKGKEKEVSRQTTHLSISETYLV